mgnify:CR=1 FL=1
MQGVDPALEGEKGRRPVLTLLREEKVAAEPTDELHFLKALALVGMFFQPKAGLRVFDLAS